MRAPHRRRLELGRRGVLCGAALWLGACGIADRQVQERGTAGTGFGGAGADFATGGSGGVGAAAAPPFGMGGVSTAGTLPIGGPAFGGASAGFGTGGKAIGFPPFGVCALDVPDVPACSGEGGATELTSGGAPPAAGAPASDGGASPNDGGAPGAHSANPLAPWCTRPASIPPIGSDQLIDNLEDGDDLTPPFANGRGVWFTVNDGSGQQFPSPACTPALPSLLPAVLQNTGQYAMRTYGKGFTLNPGGYSLVGISAKAGAACDQPVDASGFSGVQFTARGSGFVRFFMGTVETNPVTDFGTCQAGCYDSHGLIVQLSPNWQRYRVFFGQVVQEGWGAPAAFDPAHILTLEWSAKPAPGEPPPVSCFDFWIDDVALFR